MNVSLSPGNAVQSVFVNEYGSSIFLINRNDLPALIQSFFFLWLLRTRNLFWKEESKKEGKQIGFTALC